MLNLRLVTEDTELHEIVEDCLRIARGLTAQMEMLGRNEDNAQIIDRSFYVLYLTTFLYLLHYFGYNFYFMFILVVCVFFLSLNMVKYLFLLLI